MYLYLMQTESGITKIGIASDPVARLASIQTGNHERVHLYATIAFSSARTASAMESVLHELYVDRCTSGEWFDVNPEEVLRVIAFAGQIERLASGAPIQKHPLSDDKNRDPIRVSNCLQTIDGEAWYVCPVCNKKYRAANSLASHVKRHY